jgi:predicted kinase
MSDNGVLVLTGPPCAGKSAIGRTLASSPPSGTDRRSIYLEVDSLFSLLLPGSDRNRDDRMLGYDAAHLLARMLLDRGQMPVLECTYSRRQQRASLLQVIADTPETPLWVVEVAVSPDDAVLRFQRRPQATDLHERLVHERARTFPYSDQALRLASASAAPDNLAQQITAWLRLQPESVDRARWAEAGKAWD